MSLPCGHKSNTETVAQYRKRCGGRPLGMIQKVSEAPRKPRKKGQHRNSPNHSDLYTDENPKGTIKGLKFATVQDAEKSVSKIKNSGKSHAHKIQAAVAMEQRAKEMGKSSQAAVYRKFINKMKKKTKQRNEGWSDKYKKSIDCNNPKGFSQKAHCAGRKKQENVMKLCQHDECAQQTEEIYEKKDACYHKVKARYDVWPSAYASGALVKCRKVGAKNWGNKSKKEGIEEKMRPAIKKALAKKGYGPIFNAIDTSKQQLKQLRYSRGEIQDTLISMFGDEDPKILQKIKESINEKKGDFLDSLFPKAKVDKAVKIAKSMSGNMTGAVKKIEKMFKGMSKHTKVKDALQQANEGLGDKFSKRLAKYNKKNKKSRDTMKKYAKVKKKESVDEARGTCWVGYQQKGMKDKGGKMVPNCVKEITEIFYEVDGKGYGYTLEYINDGKLNEAEYQGRKVKLGKIMQGDAKKFKVYVKNPKGNVVKVNFGQGGDAKGGTMKIRKSNPKARKSFRARHNCDNPGPRHKARYWSCRKW